MNKKIRNLVFAAGLGLALGGMAGCANDKGGSPLEPEPTETGENGTPGNPSGTTRTITPQEKTLAKTLCDSAKMMLESKFRGLQSGGNFETTDFSAVHNLYDDAIAVNPNNTECQCMAGVTRMLTTTQSSAYQWLDSMANDPLAKKPSLMKAARLTADVRSVEKMGLSLAKAAQNPGEYPRVSEVQDSILAVAIPALEYALARLRVVENDTAFRMYLTPELVGESCGVTCDSFDLDLGEIFLFDAALRMLRSEFSVWTAYNFDFDENGSYQWIRDIDSMLSDSTADDSTVITTLIRRAKFMMADDPDFLNLRPGGKAGFQLAHDDQITVISKVRSSIAFVRAETDDQSDDGLKVTDITNADTALMEGTGMPNFLSGVTSLEGLLTKVNQIVSGPYPFTEDFDGNPATADASLRINLSAWYLNPPQDLRKLLPKHQWRPESEWIVRDSTGEMALNAPVYLTDAAGNETDDPCQVQFADWTFGGLLPDMHNLANYEAIFGTCSAGPIDITAMGKSFKH